MLGVLIRTIFILAGLVFVAYFEILLALAAYEIKFDLFADMGAWIMENLKIMPTLIGYVVWALVLLSLSFRVRRRRDS